MFNFETIVCSVRFGLTYKCFLHEFCLLLHGFDHDFTPYANIQMKWNSIPVCWFFLDAKWCGVARYVRVSMWIFPFHLVVCVFYYFPVWFGFSHTHSIAYACVCFFNLVYGLIYYELYKKATVERVVRRETHLRIPSSLKPFDIYNCARASWIYWAGWRINKG